MLVGSNGRGYYYLASSYVNALSNYVEFGLRVVSYGFVGGNYFVCSNGAKQVKARGVRAVVTLASDYNPNAEI